MTSRDISEKICCACLSIERKLFHLYKVSDGLNILYSLLHYNADTFRERFMQDSTTWFVCWECRAIILNIKQFRDQTCFALKQLRSVADDKFMELPSLSHLATHNIPVISIDKESDSDKSLHYCIKKDVIKNIINKGNDTNNTKDFSLDCVSNGNYEITECDENVKNEIMTEITDDDFDVVPIKENESAKETPKKKRKENKLNKNVKSRENKKRQNIIKKRNTNNKATKLMCTECDLTFENKGAKWKHIQIAHREGHKCPTCGKLFSFKFNLQRHERTHNSTARPLTRRAPGGPPDDAGGGPRRQGGPRATCAPCGLQFVSQATYEAHLKNARAHVLGEIYRYACETCDKKFRSKGEMADHVAYIHNNRREKCPVCEKLLATRRSLARHVRRAHDGVPERRRDKMCHYCGDTFKDKKSLCEHIWRHTGARPLACALCARAFRQRAALHQHVRRLHPRGA